MHPNKTFRQKNVTDHIDFIRQNSFGTLVVGAQFVGVQEYPLISHIPFLLSDDGRMIEAHLVRSNPILKLLDEPQKAVISVQGPHAYISPDWYGVEDQVPTWNYVAVRVRGRLQRLPQEKIRGVLERLSAHMESRLSPKKPWVIDKMTPDVFEKMCRMIVPIQLDVDEIDGTWKLSQNKPEGAIIGAMEGLQTSQVGSEIEQIRALMQKEMDAS